MVQPNVCGQSAADLMAGYSGEWWMAGGWAVDLHLNLYRRPHKDIDIAVPFTDLKLLSRHFRALPQYRVSNRSFLPWRGEPLSRPEFQMFVQVAGEEPPSLEFLLEDCHDGRWHYRRSQTVALPLDRIALTSAEGLPYLEPMIVMLYKAKGAQRDAASQMDFEDLLPVLDISQKQWLRQAIAVDLPDHPWLTWL